MFENEVIKAENGITIKPRDVNIDILASTYRIVLPSIERMRNLAECTSKDIVISNSQDSTELIKTIISNELQNMKENEPLLNSEDKYKYRLAELYGSLGDHRKEIKILEEIRNIDAKPFYYEKLAEAILKVDENTGMSLLSGMNTTESLITMALYYLQNNDIENAECIIKKLYELEKEDYKILSIYAIINLLKCRYGNVVNNLRELINIHDIDEYSCFLMSLAYYYDEKIDKAFKWARIGININPINKDLINILSQLSLVNNNPFIEVYLQRYLSAKNDSFVIERLARFYFHAGKYEKSLGLLNGLLIKDDKNQSIWNNLAIANYRLGKYENISKYYLQAIKCMHGEIDVVIVSNYFKYLTEVKEYKLLIDLFFTLEINTKIMLNSESYKRVYYYYIDSLKNTGKIDEYLCMLLEIYNVNADEDLRIAILNDLICFYSTYKADTSMIALYAAELEEFIERIQNPVERMRVINNVIFSYLECGRSPSSTLFETFSSNLDHNPYYNATFGLFHLKHGHIEKGVRYYEKAISYAKDKILVHCLKQKRDLEIAKTYLNDANINNALRYFNKVIKRREDGYLYFSDIAKNFITKIEKT